MKNVLGLAALIILSGCFGCASIVSKSNYPVSVQSSPVGAVVTVKNKQGIEVHKAITPATIYLSASAGFFSPARYSFVFEKEGCFPGTASLSAGLDGWYFGNILFGGLIGLLIVDPATGAMWKLDEYVSVSLSKDDTAKKVASPVVPVVDIGPLMPEIELPPRTWSPESIAVTDLIALALSEREVLTLTDTLRDALVVTDYFNVLSRDKMDEILKEQKFSREFASDDERLSELGKSLAVEKIVAGSVGRVGETFSLSVRIITVETGRTEVTVNRQMRGRADDLLPLIQHAARELALEYSKSR